MLMEAKLKIKNFGAIKQGYTEDNGYMSFDKLTVITGPQASGKSTIAKLFSLFSWLEKSLIRGDFSVSYLTQYNRFVKKYCAYHGLVNYFHADTYIDYKGMAYRMTYEGQKIAVTAQSTINNYEQPKVIYVPAERNLISVLENAENVKGLPDSMTTLLSRYIAACKRITGTVDLPLGKTSFRYDKLNKIAWVNNGEKDMHLSETASGIQSLTPLFIVLNDLSSHLNDSSSNKSIKQQETINRRVQALLMDSTLSEGVRKTLLAQITDTSNKRLLSVVEEPEQNLFPQSQRDILYSLLAINKNGGNAMVLTTHSPFIINYLALAIKANQIVSESGERKKNDRHYSTFLFVG